MGDDPESWRLDRGVKGPLLILAHSGRALAASARAAGHTPLVVDLFADCDTRALGGVWQVRSGAEGGFDAEALLQTARRVIDEHEPVGWVYGSGVDRLSRVISDLARRCRLFGNRAEVAEICTRPRRFFSLLDRLDIAYPEIRWDPPREPGWLIKRGGEGGLGVMVAEGDDGCAGEGYYQKWLPGPAYTLAFVAGGGRLLWSGFNRLYTKAYNSRLCFLFAGAINRTGLDAPVRNIVGEYARRLGKYLDLQGWHGLDFMLDATGHPRVLELNPRPGAALELWEQPGWSALEAHLRGCEAVAVRARPAGGVRAFRILYAPDSLRIPEDWRWPVWCSDLPAPGSRISAGRPVCSLHAEGETVGAVENILRQRANWLERRLFNRTTAEVDES